MAPAIEEPTAMPTECGGSGVSQAGTQRVRESATSDGSTVSWRRCDRTDLVCSAWAAAAGLVARLAAASTEAQTAPFAGYGPAVFAYTTMSASPGVRLDADFGRRLRKR